jgi:hypothetical protein
VLLRSRVEENFAEEVVFELDLEGRGRLLSDAIWGVK